MTVVWEMGLPDDGFFEHTGQRPVAVPTNCLMLRHFVPEDGIFNGEHVLCSSVCVGVGILKGETPNV